jgi:hypothetical protein
MNSQDEDRHCALRDAHEKPLLPDRTILLTNHSFRLRDSLTFKDTDREKRETPGMHSKTELPWNRGRFRRFVACIGGPVPQPAMRFTYGPRRRNLACVYP